MATRPSSERFASMRFLESGKRLPRVDNGVVEMIRHRVTDRFTQIVDRVFDLAAGVIFIGVDSEITRTF